MDLNFEYVLDWTPRKQMAKKAPVILKCGNELIPADKSILAAHSPYFAAMFRGNFLESNAKEVEMHGLDGGDLKMAIDFIYRRSVTCPSERIQQMFITAEYLGLEALERRCVEKMIAGLDAKNCLGMKKLAVKHCLEPLHEAAENLIFTQFQRVVQSYQFMDLTYDEVVEILSNKRLHVRSDDIVMCGLVRWAEHKPQERLKQLGKLLHFIKPACVTLETAQKQEIFGTDETCQDWLSSIKTCQDNAEWTVFLMEKRGWSSQFFLSGIKSMSITQLGPIPFDVPSFSVAGFKHFLYVSGGLQPYNVSQQSYYYDIYRNRWFGYSPLLFKRIDHRSVSLYDHIYDLGGEKCRTVERVDFTADRRSLAPFMINQRRGLGSVECDGALYAIGGMGAPNHVIYDYSLCSMERLDPRESRWQLMPSMEKINGYCHCSLVNGSIYSTGTYSECMERFDLRANKWELINFGHVRVFFHLLNIENSLYSTSDLCLSRFDAKTNRWTDVLAFPETTSPTAAVSLKMATLL